MNTLTVLMPAYNASRYIGEAIGSVLAQTYTDFELLIIDDGSTDKTKKIVQSFTDSRIVLISTPNQGISKALNYGLQCANGGMIARFDADDICIPHRLQRQVTFLREHPDYVLTGSDADFINAEGKYVFTYRNKEHLNEAIKQLPDGVCGFVHTSVMYKKDAVLAAGGYDEHAHSFEDHLLWKKLVKLGKVHNMDEVLVKQRFNPSSITIDERWRSREYLSLKAAVIQRGYATAEEGQKLKKLLEDQEKSTIKYGSYHALVGKKFLWDNYRPLDARQSFAASMKFHPKVQVAALWCLSFFPKPVIDMLYSSTRKLFS